LDSRLAGAFTALVTVCKDRHTSHFDFILDIWSVLFAYITMYSLCILFVYTNKETINQYLLERLPVIHLGWLLWGV
jgi:hypothetical protein